MCSIYFLGIDTSAYTTSIAVLDENKKIIADYRKLLEVKKGNRGLRQQEAVFQHIKNIPELIGKISKDIDLSLVKTISASIKPRNVKGSYMPVFKVAEGQAYILSKVLNTEYKVFSHQDGHIAAGVLDCNIEDIDEFLTLHISGGTTELLKVSTSEEGYLAEIIGGTKDISAGQLIDRIGVKLGLKFPCGKKLDSISTEGMDIKINYPVSTDKTYINYSGTETFFYKLLEQNKYNNSTIAKNLFHCIGESLVKILIKAINMYLIKNVLVVGGVASNRILREVLVDSIEEKGIGRVFFPDNKYCTDNAIGIAYLGAIKKGYKGV
jgi:N6-L-threonylcarbamoyladenine synthase